MGKKSPADIIDLQKIIGTQKGSVVSREIIRKKTGTVTLFSFDKGQGLSTHTAPFDALVILVEGLAEIKISNKPFIIKKGQAVILPAGKPHALLAVKPFKMLLVMIKS